MARVRGTAVGAMLAAIAVCASGQPAPETIPVPGGASGVGFDDLAYSSELHRVIIPAAGTGSLLLVNPADWRVSSFSGLSEKKTYQGGHDDGVTSADAGRGFLFAIDRTARRLLVIEPEDGRVAVPLIPDPPPDKPTDETLHSLGAVPGRQWHSRCEHRHR